MSESPMEQDDFDAIRVRRAPGLLRDFNVAGVLSPADVHVALRLTELAADGDESLALAAALAVRGPRLGHVYVDLATVRDTASVDTEEPVDISGLPWPATHEWTEQLSNSPLVAVGDEDDSSDCPLRLVGTWLYLGRYWREERQIAANLQVLSDGAPQEVRLDVLADGLDRLFGKEDSSQRLAAAACVLQQLAVVAGGPGTGKTTTVARIVALLAEQAEAFGLAAPLVALAAPTGKAAARLEEAVHEEASRLEVAEPVRMKLDALDASTLHRLLGWRPDSHSRFRHNRGNRLPHDVIIVDETSMVSLSLMSRLIEAVRPQARVVLVGDPAQLTSIEAGVVLGDIVGPAADGLLMRPDARTRLAEASGQSVAAANPPSDTSLGDGIVVLDRVHRFGGGIATVAGAVRAGDADAVMEALNASPNDVTWIPADVEEPTADEDLAPVRAAAVEAARSVIEAAEAGDGAKAIGALGAFRVLCAHRRGGHGVAVWMRQIERWLAKEVDGFAVGGSWYVGRPLLVTQNDYGLRLYNGDTGVVVAAGEGRITAAFERRGEVVEFSPTRLAAVDTVYAMTIHKSQGSQFKTAAVLLPGPASQILTRELLYTAVTRASEHLILAGSEEAIRAAVARPVTRASGLRWRLWGGDASGGHPSPVG